MRQRTHRAQRVGHRAQITAVALANFDQPGECQHAHGFTHGVTADPQFGAQFGLGGQAFANGPRTLGNAQTQLFQRLVNQRAFDQRGDVCHGLYAFVQSWDEFSYSLLGVAYKGNALGFLGRERSSIFDW